jgi:hypothetical protein
MNRAWFRHWGLIYCPASWQGWIMVAIFCAQVFLAIDRHSHSVSETLYGIFPCLAPAAVVLSWIASHASPRS